MIYQYFLNQALKRSCQIANHYFGKVSGKAKAGDKNQVLTIADLEIGKTLVKTIQHAFPQHNIIDEEAGIIDKGSQFTWVVDPIDGTSNFAAGLPHYGIMVGLLKETVPVAGGLALPAFGEIYLAQKNQGATCNETKIRVSSEKRLDSSLVSYGIDGHPENPKLTQKECLILSKIVLSIRNLRTSNSAYDAAQVAQGKYGAYINQTSKIWDNVAPQIIIEEAGGVYTDFQGKPLDYSSPLTKIKSNFTFCAAAPALHKQLQNIIHS